ncbi:MAG: protein translocase subunit SecD [Planctomycetes bacterium]|nr:protein translocase subunit SecD [Planctomycetota bacterium]MCB9917269.1 protein translocase subunit SecD [Planctomycetota bacterium]
MIEHSWRRLLLILVLVGTGVYFLAARGLKLGLDLQGGTRLVYSVDIEQAKADGSVDPDKKDSEILEEMALVIHQRIDPQGIKDPSITLSGNRILIELPGGNDSDTIDIQRRIENLGSLEMRMVAYEEYEGRDLDNEPPIPAEDKFDLTEEKRRLDEWLKLPETQAAIERDPVQAVRKFNLDRATDKGPKSKFLEWRPMYRRKATAEQAQYLTERANGAYVVNEGDWLYDGSQNAHPTGGKPTDPRFVPINMHEVHFTGDDLDAKALAEGSTEMGEPAIDYTIKPGKQLQYADQSEKWTGKCHAIMLNGYVRIDPAFRQRIPGRGQIAGGFTRTEVGQLVLVLKTGSLSIVPERESSTTIGPTLGDIAIGQGRISMIVGSALIVVFMLLYYRLAGLVALAGLAINVALVFGAMAAMRATLTLPGLAGIVLTVGMAVDANILIFERIREEFEKGKDLHRAIEAGFEKAMSTIFDANITTFLTGLILYNVGIGPIRGFAVTLMFGIVSSVFAAVYCGRLFFHWIIEKETITQMPMAQLFKRPHLRLLSVRKITATLSIAAVVLGLIGFFMVPNNDKYGLDFTGGAAFQVALREPLTQAQLKDALEKDPYYVERELQITTLDDMGDGKSQRFLVKLKLSPEQREAFAQAQREARKEGRTFNPEIIDKARDLLANYLANEPVGDVKTYGDENGAITELVLHSATELAVAQVKARLEKVLPKVNEIAAMVGGEKKGDVANSKDIFVSFNDEPFQDQTKYVKSLPTRMATWLGGEEPLKDVNDKTVQLSSAFPEASLIGARAVGDLRNAAIGAIILSLIIIVLYIRVRFRDFKYGIAACVALVHDVSITLGIVTVLNYVGLIHAELDLSMIAAFLTIIGYSLNDTIVVFDRIRENLELREKLGTKETFEQLIDNSVNQTLSRTVLTSGTTILVVFALFIFNYGAGSVLEGFAFSMMVGIIVGTYSSIWVANPIVLWLTDEKDRLHGGKAKPAPESVPTPA